MAPATEPRQVVLIAFGSISDPDPQDAALIDLASKVEAHLSNWQVRGATMAAEGSIARAFVDLRPDAIVFPLLMADGWIMRKVLRDALTGIGRGGASILTPLGLLPSFTGLCADMIQGAIAAAGLVAEDTTVVLAAHGSARGPRPAACAQALCQRLEQETPVRQVVPGYLEEAPFLADSLREAQQPAICLPCFVTNAFHATSDVPEAIAESGFQGLVLPAAGTIPETVELIARELEATHSEASAA